MPKLDHDWILALLVVGCFAVILTQNETVEVTGAFSLLGVVAAYLVRQQPPRS